MFQNERVSDQAFKFCCKLNVDYTFLLLSSIFMVPLDELLHNLALHHTIKLQDERDGSVVEYLTRDQ